MTAIMTSDQQYIMQELCNYRGYSAIVATRKTPYKNGAYTYYNGRDYKAVPFAVDAYSANVRKLIREGWIELIHYDRGIGAKYSDIYWVVKVTPEGRKAWKKALKEMDARNAA